MLATLGAFALGVLGAAIAGLVLLGRRFRLSPKGVKLPFVEFDASRFEDLSVVRAFTGLSAAMIPGSADAMAMLRTGVRSVEPAVLVHLGWQIVADRFVQRFLKYPDEGNARAVVGEIGVQNVDFLILFGRIHQAVLADPARVPLDFALAYAERAPSLADRIDPAAPMRPEALIGMARAIGGMAPG